MTASAGARTSGAERIPPISRPLLRFFRYIVRRHLRKGFHAVRVQHSARLRGATGPLIVYANHSSWWDPMIAYLLASRLLPDRDHYAPMEAESLRKYPVLSKVGVFPVEVNAARGAVRFLRSGEAILRAGGVLWITPQGRFVDAHERPIHFKPGMTSLAARLPDCTVLPLAIEYVFWDERTPEALLCFGEPVHVGNESGEALEAKLIASLEEAMSELRPMARSRDPRRFEEVLLRGRAGVGGFYGMGQRMRAWTRGRRYRPEHGMPESALTHGAAGE